MDICGWEERYRLEDFELAPTALVVETTKAAAPGKALDLACGTGRNALWPAEQGWSVTAVDGAPGAIEIVRKKASERGLTVDARVAFEPAMLGITYKRLKPGELDGIARGRRTALRHQLSCREGCP